MATRFRLREFIEQRGITQTEVHLRTRLAYSTVNDLCNDKPRRIELATLDVLCEALNCTIADILEYVPKKKHGRP
jgi:putative transcriptional regulator